MTVVLQARRPSKAASVSGGDSTLRVRLRHRTTLVVLILVVAAVKQVALALLYPPFQGHDEVAHFGNIRVLDHVGRLPTLGDNLPLAWVEYSRFTLDWPALYTANHPPLYYVLAWPFYRLAADDLLAQMYAVRLFAIPWFLATVWLSYLLARTIAPDDDFIVLTVTAVTAFQPQLGFEGAIVNNDILAITIGATLLYVMSLSLRNGPSTARSLVLGVLLGLGLLTKATLTIFVPVVGAVVLWMVWPRPWSESRTAAWWKFTSSRVACVGLPTLLVPLPWYVFLWRTYGDVTAFHALDDLQSTWGPPAGSVGQQLGSLSFHRERLHEMWGYYGWKLLPLSRIELWLVESVTVICLLGIAIGLFRFIRVWRISGRLPRERWYVAIVAMMVGSAVLMYGAMIYFGTRIFLTQVRYTFPIMPALVVLAMLGLRSLIPQQLHRIATTAVVTGIIGFQIVQLSRFVLPHALF